MSYGVLRWFMVVLMCLMVFYQLVLVLVGGFL